MTRAMGLALLCGVALAPSEGRTEDAVAACRGLTDGAARLKCFDQATTPAAGGDRGAWKTEEDRSGLDRSRTVVISLPADRVLTPSPYGRDTALVAVRCAEGVTSVFVAYSTMASSAVGPTVVRYRLGEAPPKSAEWSGSQDGRAYGLWSTAKAVPFVKEMLAAPDLFVRGETRLNTTEASFKLAGLAEAIKPVRETCRW